MLPSSQVRPCQPYMQSQTYDPLLLIQVPLFLQGTKSHSLTSTTKRVSHMYPLVINTFL